MKKFLSIALALLMVCVMLPVVALAADTLPDAVDGVVTMVEDTTLATAKTYTTDTTIDLGNKTLTGSINVANGANVTIKNGKMSGVQVINVYGTTSGNKTTVNIESTVEISGQYGVCVFGENNGATGASVVNLNGCKITAEAGIFVSGNLQNENGNIININGATIESVPEIAVVVNGKATVNVNNSTLKGDTAIYLKAGTVTLNNSKVIGTGTAAAPVANGNGANATGDAIVLDSKMGYAGEMVLNIGTGNTIASTNGYALQVANTDVTVGTYVAELNITGSTLTGKTDAVKLSEQFVTAVETEGNNVSATVTGGTFNGNTDEIEKLIPAGSDLVIKDGKVQPKTITIIVPGDTTPAETPKTDDQKNPSTGANDFVGLAAAAAVVALLGSAVVLRKK